MGATLVANRLIGCWTYLREGFPYSEHYLTWRHTVKGVVKYYWDQPTVLIH